MASIRQLSLTVLATQTACSLPTLSSHVALERLQPADAVAGPAAMPAESMASLRKLALMVLAPQAACSLPTLSSLLALEAIPSCVAALALSPIKTEFGSRGFSHDTEGASALSSTPACSLPILSRLIAAQALPDANAFAQLDAMPVESIPGLDKRSPVALVPTLRGFVPALPSVLASQGLPGANAFAGPDAMPVESIPGLDKRSPVALAPAFVCALPAIARLTVQALPHAGAIAAVAATPVESMHSAGKRVLAAVERPRVLRMPALASLQAAQDEGVAGPTLAPRAAAVQSTPAFKPSAPATVPSLPAVLVQAFGLELPPQSDCSTIFLAPEAANPHAEARPALLNPISSVAVRHGAALERPKPAIPHSALVPLEYHCGCAEGTLTKRLESLPSRPPLALPPFTVPLAPEKPRDSVQTKRLPEVLPFKKIEAPPLRTVVRVNLSTIGKIAAVIMIGIALWTGNRVAEISRHSDGLTAQVAESARAEWRTSDPDATPAGHGAIAKVKRALATRAATEVTDTFTSGMAAWGAETKAWARGWTRHPQGYVSIGDMALFQPSLKYTDYRMEFYGQIDDKSIGWVVRARDRKNYQAMKFTVIEPGLRPIIAMAHYAVADGKRRQKVQTPLNVMIHNGQPYHVAVNVQGSRFSVFLEGEPVESWTDDTLAEGGVGFFSEAGEKAHLYWMRLSRNQDWVGRFCALFTGDGRSSKQQTAEFWGPEFPRDTPQPVHPRMPDQALAGVVLGGFNGPGRSRITRSWRNELWNS